MKRFPYCTLSLTVLTLAVHFIPALGQVLQFDRTAVAHGQVWRFFTSHFTHFGDDHLRWDLLAFMVLGTIVERLSRSGLLVAVTLSAAMTSVSVWLLQPQFTTYRGLSGIDSALFGFVVADLLVTGWKARHRFSVVVGGVALAGFAAKCAFELATGDTVFVEAGGTFAPVPLAHLLGLVAGIVGRGVFPVCHIPAIRRPPMFFSAPNPRRLTFIRHVCQGFGSVDRFWSGRAARSAGGRSPACRR